MEFLYKDLILQLKQMLTFLTIPTRFSKVDMYFLKFPTKSKFSWYPAESNKGGHQNQKYEYLLLDLQMWHYDTKSSLFRNDSDFLDQLLVV